MKNAKKLLSCAAVAAIVAQGAAALEIDPSVAPQIDIGGRAIVTGNYVETNEAGGGSDGDDELDISDSSLLFGFSKYLFDDRRYGFATIGFKLPEDETDLEDDIFFHEVNAGIGGWDSEVKLGRSRLPNNLIQFPTLREEDLLEFTHAGNAFSDAEAEEYQVFGGVVSGTWFWPKRHMSANLTFTARTETDVSGNKITGSDFNGAGIGLAYNLPEALKFGRGLRYAGLALDTQEVSLPGDDYLHALIGGLVFNLNSDPEASWVLDLQAIYNRGVDAAGLASRTNRARAESRAMAAAIRHARRPALQTRWQAALTVGWKEYPEFNDATAWAVAPSYAYRLGSGIDLLAQYAYRSNDGELASATGADDEHRVFLGLSFAFDTTFNQHVGERGSILQLEHNILDIGPAQGGH